MLVGRMGRTAGEIVLRSAPYAALAEYQYAGMVRLIDARGLWHFSRSAARVTVAG